MKTSGPCIILLITKFYYKYRRNDNSVPIWHRHGWIVGNSTEFSIMMGGDVINVLHIQHLI